ncbi:MAG: DUF2304 family protein, partial [Oscillospiraceae bacterium]
PEQGAVYLENGDRRIAGGVDTRCNFAFVPQGNTVFSGTVRENLLLANPESSPEQLQTALRCACAEFVYELPDGLDTHIQEKGTGLSEGQAQRIAIARALLRDAPVLLFDEATSALDEETQAQVFANIRGCYQSKTLIFITHKLSMAESCDHILEIKNNRCTMCPGAVKKIERRKVLLCGENAFSGRLLARQEIQTKGAEAMSIIMNIIIILIGVMVIWVVLDMLVKKKFNESNAVLWLIIGLVAIVFGCFPFDHNASARLHQLSAGISVRLQSSCLLMFSAPLRFTLTSKTQELAMHVCFKRRVWRDAFYGARRPQRTAEKTWKSWRLSNKGGKRHDR